MSFDEQPDGDIHADDPASYSAEGEEFPPVPTQLLWMFDGIDRKEATKMMHDYAASAIAWKPSAALRTAWERAQQAEDKARRLEDSLDACLPHMKEGETVADALARLSNHSNSSGLSWNGHNIYGDADSIKEARGAIEYKASRFAAFAAKLWPDEDIDAPTTKETT